MKKPAPASFGCAGASVDVPISDPNEHESGKTAGQHWQPNPSRVEGCREMKFATVKPDSETSAELGGYGDCHGINNGINSNDGEGSRIRNSRIKVKLNPH